MRRVTICGPNGDVRRIVSCQGNAVGVHLAEGEIFVDGDVPDGYYIDPSTMEFVRIPHPPALDGYMFDYSIRAWVVDAGFTSRASDEVLARRNALLAQSDWTQLPDVPLATKEAWAIYRQELRDITGQPGYPIEIVWPQPPS